VSSREKRNRDEDASFPGGSTEEPDVCAAVTPTVTYYPLLRSSWREEIAPAFFGLSRVVASPFRLRWHHVPRARHTSTAREFLRQEEPAFTFRSNHTVLPSEFTLVPQFEDKMLTSRRPHP
jgi:hypothetical protein